MDGFFLIKVKNWDKYNGRADIKTNIWFRFDANFFQDARVFSLDATEKLMLVWLFAAQCRSGNKPFLIFNRQVASDLCTDASMVNELIEKMATLDLIIVEKGLPKAEAEKSTFGVQKEHLKHDRAINCTVREQLPTRTDPDGVFTVPSVNSDPPGRIRTDPDGSFTVPSVTTSAASVNSSSPDGSVPTNKTNKTNRQDRQTREEPAAAQPESESPSLRRSKFLFDLWNECCAALPKAMLFTEERQQKAADLLQHNASPIYWRDIIRRVADLPFANGENDRGWIADFDWFLKPDTHVKVMEGKYDARSRKQPPPEVKQPLPFGGWPNAEAEAMANARIAELKRERAAAATSAVGHKVS